MNAPTSPSLLQVAPRFCQPPTSGAEYRCLYLASGLARQMAVTHVGFLPPGAAVPSFSNWPSHRFVPVPRDGAYRPIDLLRGAVGPMPFSVLNYTRAGMNRRLAELLVRERFDIAVLEGVQLGGYLSLLRSAESRPAVVCDWHNVESEILARYSQDARGAHRRLYARLAAARMERYERWFVNQCDMHVVVSARDRDALVHRYGATVPVVVIENGVPLEHFSAVDAQGAPTARFRVLFSGAMDYHANVEGARRFAEEVWPRVRAAVPSAVFTIMGRNPVPAVQALAGMPGVEVTGTVTDVRPYYRESLVAVVPLYVGGGTRIKILEAMAARVPVVATSLGAEGLAAAPGEHYRLADSPQEMGEAVIGVLQKPEEAARLASAAREFVARRHDWSVLADELAANLLLLRRPLPNNSSRNG